MPGIYVALSHHGFGHLGRTGGLLRSLCDSFADEDERAPALYVNIGYPPETAGQFLPAGVTFRNSALDLGVAQRDSFHLDWEATALAWQQLLATAAGRVQIEADFIREHEIDLVLADTPALAADVARLAGVPCWMIGNFGWDVILSEHGRAERDPRFADLAAATRDSYRRADRFLALPFHSSQWMEQTFPGYEAVGLVCQRATGNTQSLRRELGIAEQDRCVLVTFGGGGINDFPFAHLIAAAGRKGLRLLTYDPGVAAQAPPELRHCVVTIQDPAIRVCDLLPFCDRVFSKPGYGMMAEAAWSGTPLLLLDRSGFPETEVLKAALRQGIAHRFVAPAELTSAEANYLNDEIPEPQPLMRFADGNAELVAEIRAFLTARNAVQRPTKSP